MFTRITKILFLAISLAAAGYGAVEARANVVLPSEFSIDSVAGELSSPEQIARFIFRNFMVETDQAHFGKEEFWQSPAQLLASRRGDCEDFALFASEVLKANGISAFLVNIYGKKFAHTVCVFKENGRYHVIDGDQVKRYDAESLDALFSLIYPHWETAQMVSYSEKGSCGRVLKTFKK